ncbi:poly-gamma-glutamate system protein [Novipirellula sp.]|uniref:poly-gamma-glutamate system protein n=1 Tax=Novipirellula sp. TaxID=2795430 RepID=UPI003564CF10
MKRLYWRPRQVSQSIIVFMAAFSLLGLATVEYFRVEAPQEDLDLKMQAAELSKEMMEAIRNEKLHLGMRINTAIDPGSTGMIGELMTPLTTLSGRLGAKQTSTNPNLAAVVIDMLIKAGVGKGDLVAVGYSGSFPGMNVSVLAALKTIGARPVILASAGSSQWGANSPKFLWIDMETMLYEEQYIPFRSVASSIGGYEDLGIGLGDEARKIIRKSISDNDLKRLEAEDFANAIDERMNVYRKQAGSQEYKAYINVGGGAVSVGKTIGKRAYKPGLNRTASRATMQIDSIMTRFMRKDVPVIHLVEMDQIAMMYGMPLKPQQQPAVGEGGVFKQTRRSRLLILAVLLAILGSLRIFVLTDFGHRFMKGRGSRKISGQPEPMV